MASPPPRWSHTFPPTASRCRPPPPPPAGGEQEAAASAPRARRRLACLLAHPLCVGRPPRRWHAQRRCRFTFSRRSRTVSSSRSTSAFVWSAGERGAARPSPISQISTSRRRLRRGKSAAARRARAPHPRARAAGSRRSPAAGTRLLGRSRPRSLWPSTRGVRLSSLAPPLEPSLRSRQLTWRSWRSRRRLAS